MNYVHVPPPTRAKLPPCNCEVRRLDRLDELRAGDTEEIVRSKMSVLTSLLILVSTIGVVSECDCVSSSGGVPLMPNATKITPERKRERSSLTQAL